LIAERSTTIRKPTGRTTSAFKHGSYIAHKPGTPLCNLFVTMLNRSGKAQAN
jgi:hypothetical protein